MSSPSATSPIRLPVGIFLPKAGVFADEEARVVAETIAAEIAGKVGTRRFNGHGFCYIEVGDDMAAYGAGNFCGIPTPTVTGAAVSSLSRGEARTRTQRTIALAMTIDGRQPSSAQDHGPLSNRCIYLDYHAGTPIDPAVAATMRPFFEERYGNLSSGHRASIGAKAALALQRLHELQDLALRPHVTNFRCERWRTADGKVVTASLPAGIDGHFGPQLVASCSPSTTKAR